MIFSYSTVPNKQLWTGYGYAGFNFVKTLQDLGHEVLYNDESAPVHISFSQPKFYNIRTDQYTIGYTPWESSEIPEDWLPIMNQCDEIWATSEPVKGWYESNGVESPIRVVEHGIHDVWTTKRRSAPTSGPLKFLHMGEPAVRKGGQESLRAFKRAFNNDRGVQLTFKCKGYLRARSETLSGRVRSVKHEPNVEVVSETLDIEDLVDLYHDHHAFVYPSWGEGFGLNPFQAVATGMPTAATRWWLPYPDFVDPIDYMLVQSPWKIHPGLVAKPDLDSLVDWMVSVRDNYDDYAAWFYDRSQQLHEEYSWERVVSEAIEHLL